MNQSDISECVIPGSTGSPAVRLWIPAFAGMTGMVVIQGLAGMTWLSFVFNSIGYEKALLFLNLSPYRIP